MTTWLTDPTANKYIQTYFKNFVEISGNLIVTSGQYVDISNSITLKNGAFIRFPDGTTQTTASGGGSLPTDISFSTVDISQNLFVAGNIRFSDLTKQKTAFDPGNCSLTNLTVSGTITLPNNSIENTALKANVVITDKIQTLTNKTIISNGITDVSNCIFNNVLVNGNIQFSKQTTAGNIVAGNIICSLLDASNVQVDNFLDASGAIIRNNLQVDGLTTMNQLLVSDLNVEVIPDPPTTSGLLQGGPISLTQYAYIPGPPLPTVNDYITSTVPILNISIVGVNEGRIVTIDTTNRIVTFSKPFGTSLANVSSNNSVYAYALNTTTLQTLTIKSVTTNMVCRPFESPIITNRPYVSSTSIANKTITLAGSNFTATVGTSTTGVYDSTFRLISNGMPPVGSLFGTGANTQEIGNLVTPKYANIIGLTPTTTTQATQFNGYAATSTQINCVTIPIAVATGQFIRDTTLNTDYTKGATVLSKNETNNTVTIENGTVSKAGEIFTGAAAIVGTNTILTITNSSVPLVVNNFVESTGNEIPLINNRIRAYTTNQYVFDLSCNMTPSFTTFNGYIDQNQNIVVQNGTTLTGNTFLYNGSGLSNTLAYNRVGSLLSANNYDIDFQAFNVFAQPEPAARTALVGIVHDSTTFFYSTATSPVIGDFIGHQPGSRISSLNTTSQILVSTNLTPTPVAFTKLGFVINTSTIQIDLQDNLSGISVGQFVKNVGSFTRPYITAIDSSTKIITLSSNELVPTTNMDVSGTPIRSMVGNKDVFVTKTPINTATYFTGPNLSSLSMTLGNGASTSLVNLFTSLNAITTASPYLTNEPFWPISTTRIIYKARPTFLINNDSFLETNRALDDLGCYVVSGGGNQNNCELIVTNNTNSIAPNTPIEVYGRSILARWFYSKTPTVNDYIYNSDVASYTIGGFVNQIITYELGANTSNYAVMLYKTSITATPTIYNNLSGYVSSNGKIFVNITDAQRTGINNNGIGGFIELNNVSDFYESIYLSALIPTTTSLDKYRLQVLFPDAASPVLTSTTLKSYTIYQLDKVFLYVEKVVGASNIQVGDFIDFGNTTYTSGVVVGALENLGSGKFKVTPANKVWNHVFNIGYAVGFATPFDVNIYQRQVFQVYSPVSTTKAYALSNYSTKSERTFSFYNPISDFKYTGSSYESHTPINIKIYEPQTYILSDPLTINYFPTVRYDFFPSSAVALGTVSVASMPAITSDDTFCMTDFTQTLTNKTLTNPTLTNPTLTNPTINTITLQTSTGQTSTQLGYRITGVLSLASTSTANTWIRPNNSAITLTHGVWILSYAFSVRTSSACVVMGCLTLSSIAPYANPQGANVPANVFAFQGQTNVNANYNSCSQQYVYVNTNEFTTIYLWVASSNANQVLQSQGGYFQAVRIA